VNVHLHEFEPLYEKPTPSKILQSILTVLEHVYKKGKAYDEAAKTAAKKLKLNEKTIKHYCTTDIGLTSNQFRKLLKDKEKTKQLLIGKFPEYKDVIEEIMS
jgi:hypothetical protein